MIITLITYCVTRPFDYSLPLCAKMQCPEVCGNKVQCNFARDASFSKRSNLTIRERLIGVGKFRDKRVTVNQRKLISPFRRNKFYNLYIGRNDYPVICSKKCYSAYLMFIQNVRPWRNNIKLVSYVKFIHQFDINFTTDLTLIQNVRPWKNNTRLV